MYAYKELGSAVLLGDPFRTVFSPFLLIIFVFIVLLEGLQIRAHRLLQKVVADEDLMHRCSHGTHELLLLVTVQAAIEADRVFLEEGVTMNCDRKVLSMYLMFLQRHILQADLATLRFTKKVEK